MTIGRLAILQIPPGARDSRFSHWLLLLESALRFVVCDNQSHQNVRNLWMKQNLRFHEDFL
jgi:hypothetical protein